MIDYLAGKITLDKFIVYKNEFYERMKIKNILDTKIVNIFPNENAVISENETSYKYDKLLLATGADCFAPPIKGVNKKGVFTLRNVEDADNIKAYCQDKKEVVVMGGGLLGLETANSLTILGKKVTVIEFRERLLPKQLDNEGAALLKNVLEEKGLSFVLSDTVTSIEGENKVENIVLQSGREIKADAVIISAGIRGRDGLARETNIDVGKGILVNDYMRTSIENIFAAGDPIEHNGKLYGLWPPAKEQGKIAGLNMANVKTKYSGTIPSSTLKITGMDLYSAGEFDSEDGEILVSKSKNNYKKFVLKSKQPIGAIVLGDPKAVNVASQIFAGRIAVEELRKYFQ